MKYPLLTLLLPTVFALTLLHSKPHVHAADTPITYAHQVAPILYQHCTTCHHPGGAGPFSLLTQQDAVRRAPQILAVTQSATCPPGSSNPARKDFERAPTLDPTHAQARNNLNRLTP